MSNQREWRCETWAGEHQQVPVILAADGTVIVNGVGGTTVAEAFANARLIAASPKLLEALETALSELRCYEHNDMGEQIGSVTSAIEEVKAALAAADG